MKKISNISRYIFLILSGAVIVGLTRTGSKENSKYVQYTPAVNHTKNVIAKVIENKLAETNFKQVRIFDRSVKQDTRALNTFVSSAVFLTLNRTAMSQLLTSKPENIEFVLPSQSNSQLVLELTRVSVVKKGFNIIDEKNRIISLSDYGVHYRGIVKGNENSLASISIFPSFVMGMISTSDGNFVLGSILDSKNHYTSDYILYNDRDLKVKYDFKCGDEGREDKFVRNTKSSVNGVTGSNDNIELFKDTVGVYFEADHDMYTRFGNNLNNVGQYIEGFFNYVAELYQNESIPFAISQIKVWTVEDPYANDTTSEQILYRFGYNTQDDFMGDIAHLLSTGHGGLLGGISWINTLCTAYNSSDYSGRYCFSNIDVTYAPYPIYSWTVECVTHEMGHSLGSYHTHACHWPIDPYNPSIIGAIDSCYPAEGNCFTQTQPNDHGTIMSYCHLNGAIDFTRGFGPLPGDTIRYWYSVASCIHSNLNSSEQPSSFNLLQNYPNPFNPSTNIKFALPEDGHVFLKVYDVTGRQVAKLLDSRYYTSGVYNYTFDASRYGISSGIYFYKIYVIKQNKQIYSEVKKMVLIK